MDLNVQYNRIRKSHNLDRQQVAEMCRVGGLTVSSSKVQGWQQGRDSGRFVKITEADFDAFTYGLAEWAR